MTNLDRVIRRVCRVLCCSVGIFEVDAASTHSDLVGEASR